MDKQIWYELEHSIKGADDWFSSDNHADTLPSIISRMAELDTHETFEFRIVQKTLTTEVICTKEVGR